MDAKLDGIRDSVARAEILKLLRTRHRGQQSRMDHVELWHMLRGIGLDVGEYDVLTYLQDLETLECVEFDQGKNEQTNRVSITRITICARGLRILEEKIKDEMILV